MLFNLQKQNIRMKKNLIITILFVVISRIVALAQSSKPTLDQMLVNIDKTLVTSGIIYERTTPFAKLTKFNLTNNVSNTAFFEQAITDLYLASNKLYFSSAETIRNNYTADNFKDIVDIGIINAEFSALNYDIENPASGGLMFNNNLFSSIPNRSAFINYHKLIIAPLKTSAASKSGITFNLNPNLIFANSSKAIKKLTVNFGDGIVRTVIDQNIITQPSLLVNYVSSGNKNLTFTATYSDNTIMTTNGTLYVKVVAATEGNDPLIEDGKLVSTIPYQGYDETKPIFGELDYRIFYHTNNNSPTLLKPIIISDGFDPQDKRKIQASDYINPDYFDRYSSIEHFMDYKDCNGNTKNLIEVLRAKGYDVVVVNYPNYIRNGKQIDGGADYIERNAMNMVTLIQKLNTTLQTNGSTEQLAIAAPSMGGQITRYALAYMEKMFSQTGLAKWKHNTRLWISIDSPHLGANIPYGLQSLMYDVSENGSTGASDFYYKQLNSVASKQQLIELYTPNDLSSMNGRTISQGFSSNGGSTFYQNYYNNQFNNGLPNSKGYPLNVRKISLVNGSLSGSLFGSNSQKVLELDGFINHIIGSSVVARFLVWTLPAFSNSNYVSETFQLFKGVSTSPFITNNNVRGNMDIIPGGYFNGYDQFVASVLGTKLIDISAFDFPIIDFSAEWEERANAKIHSFIPSYSALGMKQPEQDWTQPLDRNLICSNETPFDSYYGEAVNSRHTSFNCESITWLLKELDGFPQPPSYPFTADLQGPSTICTLNQNFTVSFGNSVTSCKFPTVVTWSVSPNLTVVSSTGTSITVKANSSGEAVVSASLGTGQSYSHATYIGALPTNITILGMKNTNTGITTPTQWSFSARAFTGANYYWYLDGSKYLNTASENFINLLVPCSTKYNVQCKLMNACGISNLSNTITTSIGYCKPRKNNGISTFPIDHPIESPKKLNVSVATTSSELFGHLFYDKESLANEMIQGVNVYTKKGELVMQISDLNTKATQLNFTNQADGTYFIEVLGKENFKELHTFYYSSINQEEYILDIIANGSIVINGDRAAERLYVMQQKLFNDLQCNAEAMNASTILQDFAKENATSSLGYIWLIQNALGKDDKTTAKTLLEKWTTTNTIDENFKNYYQYYIKTIDNITLEPNEIKILHTIAQGCPLTDGEIVYAARDLYNYLEPNNIDNYSNACISIGLRMANPNKTEVVNTSKANIIYPNPSNGNITIDNLDYGTKNISITNVYGKFVLQQQTNNKALSLNLKLIAGVYFVNITNSKTGKRETQKLIIQ